MKKIGDKSSVLSPITLAITNRTINYGKHCILCSKQQSKYNIQRHIKSCTSIRRFQQGLLFCALMNGLDNLYSGCEDLFCLYPLIRTIRLFKHLLQIWLVFGRCALAAIHGVDQIKVLFSVQMTFDLQIIKLLLQAPVIAA